MNNLLWGFAILWRGSYPTSERGKDFVAKRSTTESQIRKYLIETLEQMSPADRDAIEEVIIFSYKPSDADKGSTTKTFPNITQKEK